VFLTPLKATCSRLPGLRKILPLGEMITLADSLIFQQLTIQLLRTTSISMLPTEPSQQINVIRVLTRERFFHQSGGINPVALCGRLMVALKSLFGNGFQPRI